MSANLRLEVKAGAIPSPARWVFPGRNPDEHLESVRKPWSEIRKRAKLDNLEGLGLRQLRGPDSVCLE